MINQQHTEDRIVALMQKGAKIIRFWGVDPEMGSWLNKVVLIYNEREITLSSVVKNPHWHPFSEDDAPEMVICPLADELVKRPDIKDCYAGYQSDYAKVWREKFEHINQPIPRWITEQWATPVSQYEENWP